MSENPTLHVVTVNTAASGPVDPFGHLTGPQASPAPTVPPGSAALVAPAGPPPRATAAALHGMSTAALEQEIVAILAAAQRRTLAELAGDPMHADGTMAIASMTAVFALAQIGGVVGRPKLVDLSATDREDLRSVAGVARLARAALDKLAAGGSS